MAPAIKLEIEEKPAVSLILPADINTDQDQVSRAAMMQMIYQLMLLIGENISKIQKSNAESQLDQSEIAQHQAEITQESTQDYLKKTDKLQKEQEQSKKWNAFSNVMKWIGVAVAALVGSLLIETGVGLALLATAIALTAIPVSNGKTLFDMGTDALAGELEKTGLDSTWSKILAQVILIVAITVVSCGAEGISAGAAKVAASASEETAKVAIGEVGDQLGTEGAQQIGQDADRVSFKDFLPVRTAATTQMFMQTLFSSGLMQELVFQIPGMDKNPVASAIVMVLLQIIMIAAAYKMTPGIGGTTLFSKMASVIGNPTKLRLALGTFIFSTQVTTEVANGGQSYNTYEQGKTNADLAPSQTRLMFGEGFLQIMTQLSTLAQKMYNETMNANEVIFKADFSSDMSACVAAQQYQG